MDEITERTGLQPTPLTWPVGIAGDFRGVLDRRDGSYRRFTRTAGGATIAPEETLDRRRPRPSARATPGTQAVEEVDAARRDRRRARPGAVPRRRRRTPVLFASAVLQLRRRRSCSTPWSTSRPPPPAAPDADGGAARARRPVQRASCSRCRPAWTPPTATGWPSSAICSGRLRARHGGHPRRHRPAVRHQVRPAACSAASARASTSPTPATSSAWSTPPPCGVGDTLYADAAGHLPAAHHLRARALRRLPRPGHRQAQAVPPRHRAARTARASSRCCAPTAAATRRRCSPPSARCSSRWPSTGWSTSSARRSTSTGCPTRSRCAPTRRPRRRRRRPRRRGAAAHRRRAARAVHRQVGPAGVANKPELTLEPLVAAQLG